MDMNIEVLNQLAELNPSFLETFNIIDFSRGTSSTHQEHVIPTTNADIDPLDGSKLEGMNEVLVGHSTLTPYISADVFHGSKDRQVMETSNINPKNISSAASENGVRLENDTTRKKSLGKRKKGMESTGKEVEKSEEAIRVRARRGQASCSHSLAERVRREKINDRLRRLQDLVPGCYKTMGLVEVLDQIINYVHSLQSQVEFLSMELAAASSFCDFNLDSEAINRNAAAPSRTFKAQSVTFKPAF